jgi:hypothetical protein
MAKVETKTIRDAHGNDAEVPVHVGTGAEHLKDKHPNGRFTGRHDAHGNEIWETPKKERGPQVDD